METTSARRRPSFTAPALLSLATFALAAGCHDDGSSSAPLPDTSATVSGTVYDDRGEPVAGAEVEVLGAQLLRATTDAHGWFALELQAGSHQARVRLNGLLLCEACFSVGGAEWCDLGFLYPGRDSGCGGPRFCPGDLDCDGVGDADELAGWPVEIVAGDGGVSVRTCSSDPARADTDGDGLADGEELAARIDPSRRDTDGDALPDFSELFAYKSSPSRVDSDGDARGPAGDQVSDPNLWDGHELRYLGTSPTLADTDGDGLTDWEEIHSGGINPLVADLPRMALDLHGDPTIVLNVTDIDTSERKAISSTLEKESENYERTDTESTKMSIDNTVKIHQELQAGTGNWPPSYEAKITADTEFKHGYSTESVSSWTEGSVSESKQTYDETVASIRNIDYDDGMLWTGIKIVNDSDLSFRIRDLRVTAYRMKPGGAFAVIGNLTLGELGPDDSWIPFEGDAGEFVLGPSAEYTDLVGADHLPAQVMRELISNPTALLFEVGSYSLFKLDEFGNATVSFAALGETVVQRTGLIVIDYDDGRIDRHMVATNVYRHPDGSGRGLTLGEALSEAIGLDYATAPLADGTHRRVLTRLGPRAAYIDADDPAVRGFWIVGGTSALFDAPLTVDFDEIVLRSGERINLTYVEDSDGDGIFDREEYLLDTRPDATDSDGDGLGDYDESKVGWEVAVQGETAYRCYPDPRFHDVDGDYLNDSSEAILGTDPYDVDTDQDGLVDGFDTRPLVPPCLDGGSLGLAAWLDGTTRSALVAADVWDADGTQSDGVLSRDGLGWMLGDEPVFRLNPDLVPEQDSILLPPAATSPLHEYSVSLWLYWQGMGVSESWGTLLTKGPRDTATFALSISETGQIRTSVYRRVHDKCVFLGCDGCCADGGWNERTELTTAALVPLDTWVHVTATFGSEWIRVYLDGEIVAGNGDAGRSQKYLWRHYESGLNDHYLSTESLIQSGHGLRIGADTAPSAEGPFRGFLDDVRYFHRALTADEASQLARLGVCRGD